VAKARGVRAARRWQAAATHADLLQFAGNS